MPDVAEISQNVLALKQVFAQLGYLRADQVNGTYDRDFLQARDQLLTDFKAITGAEGDAYTTAMGRVFVDNIKQMREDEHALPAMRALARGQDYTDDTTGLVTLANQGEIRDGLREKHFSGNLIEHVGGVLTFVDGAETYIGHLNTIAGFEQARSAELEAQRAAEAQAERDRAAAAQRAEEEAARAAAAERQQNEAFAAAHDTVEDFYSQSVERSLQMLAIAETAESAGDLVAASDAEDIGVRLGEFANDLRLSGALAETAAWADINAGLNATIRHLKWQTEWTGPADGTYSEEFKTHLAEYAAEVMREDAAMAAPYNRFMVTMDRLSTHGLTYTPLADADLERIFEANAPDEKALAVADMQLAAGQFNTFMQGTLATAATERDAWQAELEQAQSDSNQAKIDEATQRLEVLNPIVEAMQGDITAMANTGILSANPTPEQLNAGISNMLNYFQVHWVGPDTPGTWSVAYTDELEGRLQAFKHMMAARQPGIANMVDGFTEAMEGLEAAGVTYAPLTQPQLAAATSRPVPEPLPPGGPGGGPGAGPGGPGGPGPGAGGGGDGAMTVEQATTIAEKGLMVMKALIEASAEGVEVPQPGEPGGEFDQASEQALQTVISLLQTKGIIPSTGSNEYTPAVGEAIRGAITNDSLSDEDKETLQQLERTLRNNGIPGGTTEFIAALDLLHQNNKLSKDSLDVNVLGLSTFELGIFKWIVGLVAEYIPGALPFLDEMVRMFTGGPGLDQFLPDNRRVADMTASRSDLPADQGERLAQLYKDSMASAREHAGGTPEPAYLESRIMTGVRAMAILPFGSSDRRAAFETAVSDSLDVAGRIMAGAAGLDPESPEYAAKLDEAARAFSSTCLERVAAADVDHGGAGFSRTDEVRAAPMVAGFSIDGTDFTGPDIEAAYNRLNEGVAGFERQPLFFTANGETWIAGVERGSNLFVIDRVPVNEIEQFMDEYAPEAMTADTSPAEAEAIRAQRASFIGDMKEQFSSYELARGSYPAQFGQMGSFVGKARAAQPFAGVLRTIDETLESRGDEAAQRSAAAAAERARLEALHRPADIPDKDGAFTSEELVALNDSVEAERSRVRALQAQPEITTTDDGKVMIAYANRRGEVFEADITAEMRLMGREIREWDRLGDDEYDGLLSRSHLEVQPSFPIMSEVTTHYDSMVRDVRATLRFAHVKLQEMGVDYEDEQALSGLFADAAVDEPAGGEPGREETLVAFREDADLVTVPAGGLDELTPSSDRTHDSFKLA